ncbi:MAG: Uma2 family endonuclease [Polaribacter sp.]|jgi:Uma2 family endonuclease
MKYEYHNGKIYALARGTINHSLISGNAHAELRLKLRDKGSNYLPFNSDLKLFIETTNSYVYPDTMVVCGTFDDSENCVKNATLIVEVLSKSTADYDRGDKFWLYRQIPSFKEYVLIEQKKHVVDIHYKHDNSDLWSITRYKGLNDVVKLQSLGIELSMQELYYQTNISSEG